jgi:hypothetical protein
VLLNAAVYGSSAGTPVDDAVGNHTAAVTGLDDPGIVNFQALPRGDRSMAWSVRSRLRIPNGKAMTAFRGQERAIVGSTATGHQRLPVLMLRGDQLLRDSRHAILAAQDVVAGSTTHSWTGMTGRGPGAPRERERNAISLR